ncbi:hypothetical protein P4O66_004668 [Electrophorus voltai]|uniref:Iodothyronine deiodinase n=1 Tax=Electrophorus voltai TaxID=2609070 RepID=A0AAD9E1Q4_9TELE|nr:hypothetical protein P4O66_004668 [Electrophorus voltai]
MEMRRDDTANKQNIWACLALALSSLLKLLSVASPSLTKKIITSMGARSSMTQNPRFRYEDWGPSFVTLTFLKTVLEDLWCGLGEEAFEGYGAPDCALVTMGGRTSSVHQFLRVLEVAPDPRFCISLTSSDSSCGTSETWPISSSSTLLKRTLQTSSPALERAQWSRELHAAVDRWAFHNNVDIRAHRSLQERLSAARILLREEPLCHVVVDQMTDVASQKYGAKPERFYVIQSGKVTYKVSSRHSRTWLMSKAAVAREADV